MTESFRENDGFCTGKTGHDTCPACRLEFGDGMTGRDLLAA